MTENNHALELEVPVLESKHRKEIIGLLKKSTEQSNLHGGCFVLINQRMSASKVSQLNTRF